VLDEEAVTELRKSGIRFVLKERLKADFDQEEILVVERDVEML
jgi:hypothetical protein